MSAKVHFQSWPEPHAFDGSDLEMPCGIVLAKAVAVAMVDAELVTHADWNGPLHGCPECHEQDAWNRYCYAVVSGEESKQMEAKRGNS